MRAISAFLANESGATAIEYAIIASGLSIVILASVNGIGTSLNAAAIRLRRADRLDLYGPFAAAQTRDRADRDATTVRGDAS